MSRCLVLNADYGYLSIAERWIDALGLVVAGKAEVLEAYPEVVRSQYLVFPLPAVVVMRYLVRTRRRHAIFDAPSKQAVFTRDDFACQYCGARVSMKSGTRDHVIPRSRGGPDTLANVVTACRACNARKGDRTPSEAGMHLLRPPRPLTDDEKLRCLLKTVRTRERTTWLNCLRRLGISLWASRAA
ncbi:MAG: HNH endonuclease [Planctomycetota bacterium]|nr:HNH endonuclease [Planctomycetota bacterium]MCX8039116.1 HNH endonuclease [Planctomycetota bacterium]MDW8373710.1 HNH endonuclease [Planctomycetota bacterium]